MSDFYIYKINNNGADENIISFLPPNKAHQLNGLHTLCVYGKAILDSDNKAIKSMINNTTFVDFMHQIVEKHALEIPEVLSAGNDIGNGWLNIHDGRPQSIQDKTSNIVGVFKVENGKVFQNTYQRNPNYQLFNEFGLFSIHPYLEKILYTEIDKIIFGTEKPILKLNQLDNKKFQTRLIDTNISDEKKITFKNVGDTVKVPNTFIIGNIKIDTQTNEIINFTPNNEFVIFLHSVIKENGTNNPMMISAGKSQKEGWIYIIDARTPTPQGDVPVDDIIGAFEVKNGILNKDSYSKNDKHILISPTGLFGLDDYMSDILIAAMKENIAKQNVKSDDIPDKFEKRSFLSRFFKK